jgi:hypothetical protein
MQTVSWRWVVSAVRFRWATLMVAVASSRCAWPVDHTLDAGGVVALCGLGRALPLGSVVGTVPRLGLG